MAEPMTPKSQDRSLKTRDRLIGWSVSLPGALCILLVIVIIGVAAAFLLTWWLTGDEWKDVILKLVNYRGAIPNAIVAVVGLVIAWRSFKQKQSSDRRDAYYNRIEWAMNLTLDSDERKRRAGWQLLPTLVTMSDRSDEDETFVQAISEYIKENYENGVEREHSTTESSEEA
ncbi:hypothetical protein HMPREF3155_09285 [Corynebacterium sp. HMSC06D04]|nr:hypothetical protein HMPREF2724_10250 [Corynebacterium sp. HMSC071F07]OFR38466.1 hypothetical protein HMPREF2888_10785 [Corynebacterium sp. HMSC077D03]OFT32190.1 hypothetical protein HMPREF3169_11155 [Corynebacterium sp. HMSC08C04]OFT44427.1 hypothetical protein HMPREF3158_11360 [Corynebacterium sp. HMSC06G04]OFT50173.1 hypothetical protein HMPREF3155_09285 [Corynebacterium sp. HMSC06D04]OHO65163.1 hypothetical protein HMPREF2692_11185 [Corynebacterium sp. HMSC036D03]